MNGPVPSPKLILSFSIVGVMGGVFLFDGLWGFGESYDLALISIVVGLALVSLAFRLGWGLLTASIGLVIGSSVLTSLVCELILVFGIVDSTVPRDQKGFERWIKASWPREVDPVKGENVYRILGLSDSFGMTGGLKNYHWILVDSLMRKQITAELVNFSVSGYQPIHEYQVLKHFAGTYQPDLVLHGIYAGNDFQDTGGERVFVHGLYLHRFTDSRALRPMRFLCFKWIRWQAKRTWDHWSNGSDLSNEPGSELFTQAEFLKVEFTNLLTFALDAPRRMKWDDTLQIIQGIQEEAHRMGSRYVMVIHPDRCQVEPAFRNRLMEEYHLNPDNFDLELLQKYLLEDCNRLGIPCLDLLPAFRERGSGGGLYLPNDTHWNDEGNRLAAECIEKFLLSHGLIPLQENE